MVRRGRQRRLEANVAGVKRGLCLDYYADSRSKAGRGRSVVEWAFLACAPRCQAGSKTWTNDGSLFLAVLNARPSPAGAEGEHRHGRSTEDPESRDEECLRH